MVIKEWISGELYAVSADGKSTEKITISEDMIISNSCSITSKCCDDRTFSVGGVYPAELAIKLILKNINSYRLFGSKIIIRSQYENGDLVLRGEFWVTSAQKIGKNIYSIKAQDALVWLDSGSYADSDDSSTEHDNPIYNLCSDATMFSSHSEAWTEDFCIR